MCNSLVDVHLQTAANLLSELLNIRDTAAIYRLQINQAVNCTISCVVFVRLVLYLYYVYSLFLVKFGGFFSIYVPCMYDNYDKYNNLCYIIGSTPLYQIE